MQRLEISGAVRPLKSSLGVKWLTYDARKLKHKITYMFQRNALWDPKRSQNVIEVQYKL
jgi:hypothetical protein